MDKSRNSNPRDLSAQSKDDDISVVHGAEGEKALTLINQGKLSEAEIIYRELIAAGSKSHIVYGNLGCL